MFAKPPSDEINYSGGCRNEVPPPELPEITTADVTEYVTDGVANGSAGGTIISDGGSPVKSMLEDAMINL